VIVDSQAPGGKTGGPKVNWKAYLHPMASAPFIGNENDGQPIEIIVSRPYYVKGSPAGQFFLWVSSEAVEKLLFRRKGDLSDKQVGIICPSGKLYVGSNQYLLDYAFGPLDLQQTEDGKIYRVMTRSGAKNRSEVYVLKVQVFDAPFSIAAVLPDSMVSGISASWHLVLAMVLLSFVVIRGGFILLGLHTSNAVLKARLDESSRGKREMEKINRMLQTEIDERRHVEGALKESEERLKIILEMSQAGIVVIDSENHEIIDANPRACELIGKPKEEIVGHICHTYICPAEKGKCPVTDLNQTVDMAERILIKSDGSNTPILKSVVSTMIGDRSCLIESFMDITAQKKTERLLAKTIERVNGLAKEAQSANIAKSQFLAVMSHEIRTPMNAIIGLTELCLETALSGEQKDLLTRVQVSAELLLKLINDILDISKVEAGEMELEKTGFDIRDIVEKVFQILSMRAAEKGIEFLRHIDPLVPHTIMGDPNRLYQVLMNLAGNAVKFTDQGKVAIRVETGGTDFRNQTVPLHFMVMDTGIGISKDDQARIFNRFSQADSSITRKYGGTGLGLSIVKSLVELMGGEIWVDSDVNKGSTFHFRLALERGEEKKEVPPANMVQDAAKPGEEGKYLSILLAEDNPDNQNLAVTILSKAGYRVDVAENGLLAVKAAKDFHYDLILMDIEMPLMNGFEATEKIREHELQRAEGSIHRMERTSIIAVTAHAIKGYQEKCFEHGMDDFITKPLTKKGLLKIVEKWADSRPAVLVVDDSIDNRLLIEKYLDQDNAFQLVFAENGKEAVDVTERRMFSLILMDMEMPVMDGYEAARFIRNAENRDRNEPKADFKSENRNSKSKIDRIPIIAMTAHDTPEEIQKCLDVGCTDHIAKPIRRESLMKTIVKWLKPGLHHSVNPQPQVNEANN